MPQWTLGNKQPLAMETVPSHLIAHLPACLSPGVSRERAEAEALMTAVAAGFNHITAAEGVSFHH